MSTKLPAAPGATLWAIAALACTVSHAGAAPKIEEVLTPAQYFQCQIAAQKATLQGLEERVRASAAVNSTPAERRQVAELSQHRVALAMHGCGRQNAGTLGAYAHRNAEALATWLAANPQVKAHMDQQRQRIASYSAQMPAVAPPAKR
jgi:phage replication-related protein YjqB (UPF0714/DUF867 family)